MPAFASEAFYQLGELQRQRGDLEEAELAFRRASDLGREPQRGLALVRLAQGKVDAAAAAVRRALAQESNRLMRARLLSAQVEIAIVAADLPTATEAADELGAIARDYGSLALEAAAAFAQGRIELASGDAPGALAAHCSAPGSCGRPRTVRSRRPKPAGCWDWPAARLVMPREPSWH